MATSEPLLTPVLLPLISVHDLSLRYHQHEPIPSCENEGPCSESEQDPPLSLVALLWQQNRVDHVNDPVAAQDVSLDHLGVAHHYRTTVDADGEGLTVHRLN